MRRMFICDPVCVLPFGHNAPSLRYFRSFFLGDFDQVECCIGLPYPEQAARQHGLRRYFEYLYSDVMPLEHGDGSVRTPVNDAVPFPESAYARIARADYRRLIADEAMTREDVIFLPSADFYSVHGLLEAIRERPPAASPRVLLRLIGVMEHANHVIVEPLQHLGRAIEAASAAGYPVLVAAETPSYASTLAADIKTNVAMLPYPLLSDLLPLPAPTPFVVASVGSARFDKGYLRLHEIIRRVRLQHEPLDIEFRVQGLTDRHVAHHQTYTSQLYAIPGVELLPSVLTQDEMHALYQTCHAVLLPYDRDVYRRRGSAVLMEAIAYGRFAIGQADLGFSSQIDYYQNGVLCSTADQFADAILHASRQPRDALQRQLVLARTRYHNDTSNAYRHWLES